MWTLAAGLFTAFCVVAVATHAFAVEGFVGVWAISDPFVLSDSTSQKVQVVIH